MGLTEALENIVMKKPYVTPNKVHPNITEASRLNLPNFKLRVKIKSIKINNTILSKDSPIAETYQLLLCNSLHTATTTIWDALIVQFTANRSPCPKINSLYLEFFGCRIFRVFSIALLNPRP
jgi:hypothetical protein